ncbi:molybdate ABC transporter substrate-binding protein [Syntrophotalea acetylenivorans]|uniref:Molybdate ABC transporter substrate-binding protein n=1 Tax=Syntrophotalea acetylenivorans TaxID=1842532 RepID=A0A1L3GKI5_9BACT|nr:tungstate ABC transporter substrate-binding protein WtpA [Syntrophotalea acetylenivorans]APG26421.1 molybdate ABC transporter substrate-binding protein [Syntrophotalea acetylenivorans]
MKKLLGVLLVLALGVFSYSFLLADNDQPKPAGKLVVFHAGSLSVPFAAIEKQFEAKYPQVDVLRESGGSTKMARLISEVGKAADIMASADYNVIDKSLIPDHAALNIRFATNQLVLCYTDKSKFANEVSADNWTEILQRPEVVWGHSAPDLDPCGYRSLMVLQLAEKYLKQPGLYEKIIANRPLKNVLPKAKQLVALLKNGEMDYAWEYRSVAVQHGLKYVTLPDEINLGNYLHNDFYKQATVEVSGKKPGTTLTRVGKSITYGVTIVDAAPNKPAAEAFLAFMLDPEGGLKVLEEMGQPPFVPARVPTKEMHALLPASLKPLVEIKQ